MEALPICQTWTTQLDSLLDDVEQGGHTFSQLTRIDEIHLYVFRISIADWPNAFGSIYRPEGQAQCQHGGQRVIPTPQVQERFRLMIEARGFRLHLPNEELLEPLPKENLQNMPSHIAVTQRAKKRRWTRWLDRLHPTRLFDEYPVCWAWSDELDRDMDFIAANNYSLVRAKRSGCAKSVDVNNAVMGVDKWPNDYGVKFYSAWDIHPDRQSCFKGHCAHHHVDVMPRYSTRKRLRNLVEHHLNIEPDLLGKTDWYEP